jgi:hypothetical protein
MTEFYWEPFGIVTLLEDWIIIKFHYAPYETSHLATDLSGKCFILLHIFKMFYIITYFYILNPFEKLDKVMLECNDSFHCISSHLILKRL